MAKHLSNMEAFHQIINNNQLVVVHVMRIIVQCAMQCCSN